MDERLVNLGHLGWVSSNEQDFSRFAQPDDTVGRVTAIVGRDVVVETGTGTLVTQTRQGLARAARDATDLPAVGDWVLVAPGEPPMIRTALPRRSALLRKAAGTETVGQVLAANLDLVLVVASLAAPLRPRGIERYLTMAWQSGAIPIVVLTKADIGDNVAAAAELVRSVAIGVDVLTVSCVTGEGIADLRARLVAGATAVLVGPSGAGKSTLLNQLGLVAQTLTGEVRQDQKGRHTTTRRELFTLPGGAMVIDTPGLRELQLWHGDEGLTRAFMDVVELAALCRFSDCGHDTEPGCAVNAAIADGALSRDRLDGYRDLERELGSLAVRADGRAQAQQRQRLRVMNRALRQAESKRE